ncbi:MAG TPA: sulfatase-like hydrolase/transferase, partial [Allosphingosinicella sp.]
MLAWCKRMTIALAGGSAAAMLVALVESRSSSAAEGGRGPSLGDLFLADAAVLAPVALLVAGGVGVAMIFLEPERPYSWREHFAQARCEPVLQRSRTAAIAPLAILVGLVWTITVANVARQMLSRGAPFHTGLELAFASAAILGGLSAVALAFVPPLRRTLATAASRFPWLIDPIVTGALAAAVSIGVLAYGISVGNTGGEGGGPFGIFGVLKRGELDLRPVINLLAIVAGAYTAPIALARFRVPWGRWLLAFVVAFAPLALTVQQARVVSETPLVAQRLEREAPLGKLALALVRKLTDRDHDGASPYFAGGDCDDHDKRRSPLAVDVPGNGVDEDCSGSDTPAVALSEASVTAGEAARPRLGDQKEVPKDLNLIFITVDTLRPDLGFMGYPKPVSPNLDKLAEKSVIFDDAYSFASYTGKSMGP